MRGAMHCTAGHCVRMTDSLSAKRSTYWENQDEILDLSVAFSVCLHIYHWRILLTDETPTKCNCILNKDQVLKALVKENKFLSYLYAT